MPSGKNFPRFMTDRPGKEVFFISDAHLGFPSLSRSLPREKMLVRWLREIKPRTQALFLVGDMFDFWYEYKRVVPRGFTRFLGEVACFTDEGIPVHFFTGNHDLWTTDYLEKETGMIIHREPLRTRIGHHRFLIAHGDGLGPGERGYKLMKRIFRSRILQWCFSRLHPNFSLWFGHTWSHSSRRARENEPFLGADKEHLFQYAKKENENDPVDYFIFGHRHHPVLEKLNENSKIIYLGDWVDHFTYAVYNGEKVELKKYR